MFEYYLFITYISYKFLSLNYFNLIYVFNYFYFENKFNKNINTRIKSSHLKYYYY